MEPLHLASLVLLLLVAYAFLKRKRFNRHKHNWKKAHHILDKLNAFTGDNLEARKIGYLRKIYPFIFEEVLLYAMKLKGLKIIRNKKYTGDGGIDGKMIDQHKTKYLIQAKRYSSYINLAHVKEFGELVRRSKWAEKGLFIHTGKTGKGVYEELKNYPVKIVSGKKLIDLISVETKPTR